MGGTAGWDRSHLLLLTDLGGNENPGTSRRPAPNISPSRKNLDWAFQQWLASRAQPGDIIVFYFAGPSCVLCRPVPWRFPSIICCRRTSFLAILPRGDGRSTEALDGYCPARQVSDCLLARNRLAGPAGRRRSERLPGRPGQAEPGLASPVSTLARSHRVACCGSAFLVGSSGPSAAFTTALLAGLGDKTRKLNVAACLQSLHRDSRLKLDGFQSIGGVPPDLTLWADQLGVPVKQPRPEMVLQVGHADRILEIASSPDSSTIITSSQDSTIRVWSPDQKALLRVLTGHAAGTTALALSRNGRWLASGGGMGEVLVHDLANDSCAGTHRSPTRRRGNTRRAGSDAAGWSSLHHRRQQRGLLSVGSRQAFALVRALDRGNHVLECGRGGERHRRRRGSPVRRRHGSSLQCLRGRLTNLQGSRRPSHQPGDLTGRPP